MSPSDPPDPWPPGLRMALNAVRNASRVPVTAADIVSMVRTGRGDPSHLRALFGDTSLDTLMRLAIAYDVETATLIAAYARARTEAAAANPELEALARGQASRA